MQQMYGNIRKTWIRVSECVWILVMTCVTDVTRLHLKKYHTRVFDMHIKDVTDSSKAGVGIEIGRGKIDFPALMKMMRKVNYTGMCSLEYEKDMKDPFLGIAESIGYFKAVSDIV